MSCPCLVDSGENCPGTTGTVLGGFLVAPSGPANGQAFEWGTTWGGGNIYPTAWQTITFYGDITYITYKGKGSPFPTRPRILLLLDPALALAPVLLLLDRALALAPVLLLLDPAPALAPALLLLDPVLAHSIRPTARETHQPTRQPTVQWDSLLFRLM